MVTAIIQARMGSSRLPGKVMRLLTGKPMLQHVVERAQTCPSVSQIIVATTTNDEDGAIAGWCSVNNVECVRWNRVLPDGKNDVLCRFVHAADRATNDVLMRVTADCPLWSPELGEEVAQAFLTSKPVYDIASNVHPQLDGFDTEVFWRESLLVADGLATDSYDRQHVTPWMYRELSVLRVDHLAKAGGKKWSVDTEEDFERAQNILDVGCT